MRRGRETELAQEIQKLVFTDADQLRHEESMNMAQQQAAIVSPPMVRHGRKRAVVLSHKPPDMDAGNR